MDMSKFIARILLVLIMLPGFVKAGDLQEFVRSCTYGMIAGALVGTASLAFSEDPSSNLNPIARGASLGLYAGIGIGLYQVNQPNKDSSDYVLIPMIYKSHNQSVNIGAQVNLFRF